MAGRSRLGGSIACRQRSTPEIKNDPLVEPRPCASQRPSWSQIRRCWRETSESTSVMAFSSPVSDPIMLPTGSVVRGRSGGRAELPTTRSSPRRMSPVGRAVVEKNEHLVGHKGLGVFDGAGGVAKAAGNDKKDQMDVEAIFDVAIVSGLDALDAVSKEHAVDAAIGKGILHVWDARLHVAFSDLAQLLGRKQRLGKVTGFGVNDFA